MYKISNKVVINNVLIGSNESGLTIILICTRHHHTCLMENTNEKYLNSTNPLQRITSLAEIHWVCCGLASRLLPSQPFLIQLTQDVLEGQLWQGRMLHQLPWFPAVSRSHPTPRILQMQVLAVRWWAVFHAGVPETGVWGIWSGRVRCGMGKVHLLC